MKKRILSLLLAICMIATLLPVIASADDAGITVNLCEYEEDKLTFVASLTVTEGGKAAYATTDAYGTPTTVTNGSIPSDHFIKWEYPQGGTPTLTLKGAYLKAFGEVIDLSTFNLDVNIVVETDSKIESTGKRGIWRMCDGDLTITGPGKLTLNCFSTTISFEGDTNPGSLTFKNANVEAITTDNNIGRTLSIPCGNLTIDGGTVNLEHKNGTAIWVGMGKADNKDSNGNITITGNATVNATTFQESAYHTVYAQNEFKIDSGFLTAVRDGASGSAIYAEGNVTITGGAVTATSTGYALRSDCDIIMTDGTITLSNSHKKYEAVEVGALNTFSITGGVVEITSTSAAFAEQAVPDLSEHPGYSAVGGDDKASAATYNKADADAYKYFKLENGTTVDKDDEEETTEDSSNNTTEDKSDESIKAPANDKNDDTGKPEGDNTLVLIIAIILILGAGAAAVIVIIKKRASA